jgi:opacity protein-like surface antigen
MRKLLFVCALVLIVSTVAAAQDTPKAEVMLGYYYTRIFAPKINGSSAILDGNQPAGAAAAAGYLGISSPEVKDFNLNGGIAEIYVSANRHWGVFGQYWGQTGTPFNDPSIPASVNLRGQAVIGGPRFYVPLHSERLQVFGQIGAGIYHLTEKATIFNVTTTETDNGWVVKIGAGVDYNINKRWGIRNGFGYKRIEVAHLGINSFYYEVGGKIRF